MCPIDIDAQLPTACMRPIAPSAYCIPLIVAVAFFMETLDASVIVTALPAIARSDGETTLALSLGISAYLVAGAVFVPAAGWVSERFGARNVFATAVGAFTLASTALSRPKGSQVACEGPSTGLS